MRFLLRDFFPLALLLATSAAKAADVDWKVYSGPSIYSRSFCFYDSSTVSRTPSNYVRVWTKCLAQKDLDGVNLKDEVGRQIVEAGAQKIVDGYVAPIIVIGRMPLEQLPSITTYEEIANRIAIQPEAQIFHELNCAGRIQRRLSTSLHVNGRDAFQNKPSEWFSVAPESISANLLKLLCRS